MWNCIWSLIYVLRNINLQTRDLIKAYKRRNVFHLIFLSPRFFFSHICRIKGNWMTFTQINHEEFVFLMPTIFITTEYVAATQKQTHELFITFVYKPGIVSYRCFRAKFKNILNEKNVYKHSQNHNHNINK